MRNPDQISSLFWLVVGIGIAIFSLRYGFGDFLSPGAGFITFFAGAILSFLAMVLFIASVRSREPRKGLGSLWEGREVGKVLYVTLLLLVYSLTLTFLGFLITTFFLLLFLFRIRGAYRLRKIIIMSLLISAGAYLVFQVWLQVQLPKGILQGII
jgi:putative tricarboxylic transport membrane protein